MTPPSRIAVAVAVIVAGCLLLGTEMIAHAQTVQVTPLAKDGRVLVTLQMPDVFTPEMREAMHSGLPLTFFYEVELKRSSTLWVDRTIASATISATVRFDNLTRRYAATRREDGRIDAVETLDREDAARAWLTVFEKLPIFSSARLAPNAEYNLRVRAHYTPRNASFVWPWEGGVAGLARFTFLR